MEYLDCRKLELSEKLQSLSGDLVFGLFIYLFIF